MNPFIRQAKQVFLDSISFRYKKRSVQIVYAVFTIVIYLLVRPSAETAVQVVSEAVPLVEVSTPAQLSGSRSLELVGVAAAKTQAELQFERGGRVVAVSTTLGATVYAGTVIARLESAAESASLLQAEGAYEAAVAGSAQGDVGLSEARNSVTDAKNNAVTTYKNAYTTVSGIVFGSLDQFYSNPDSQLPGVKVGGTNASFQNAERVKLQSTLPSWQQKTVLLTAESNLKISLSEAEVTTRQIIAMVDDFISAFNSARPNSQYSVEDYRTFGMSFNAVRAELVGVLSSIDGARSNLIVAEENLNRAEISASGSTVSSADAQIKQALGSLRAAQANYAKTVIVSPITGTVNSLTIRTGDFVSAQTPVANIANNNGLEITTFVGESDREQIAIGDSVTLNGIATGTVTNISPAIDAATGKIEVRISSDNPEIQNGNTVRISKTASAATANEQQIIIPLTAVKFESSNGYVFTVVDNTLVRTEVVVGPISGDSVRIESGITLDTEIVVDARGKTEGTKVEISK